MLQEVLHGFKRFGRGNGGVRLSIYEVWQKGFKPLPEHIEESDEDSADIGSFAYWH